MENDSKKFIHYAGSIFLLAAATAVVWQITGPSWFKNIRAEVTNQPYARTIVVSAEGKVTARPDIAETHFAVVSEMPTVKQVTADNNKKMNEVIKSIKALGVESKDITTSQYNLRPLPDYSMPYPKRPAKIVGYHLDQEITVKIRNLDIIDSVLDAAIKSGANEVGALSFDVDDAGALKKEARTKAFGKAKEKAAEMASLAGVKLGRVVTFNESASSYPIYPQYAMKAAIAEDSAPAPNIEPGTKEFTLNVSVTYEIE